MRPDVFGKSTVPVLQEVLKFTQRRHEVLAGNVANLDTPGYKVRDLSVENFHERLRDAIEARDTTTAEISSDKLHANDDAELREVSDSMKAILMHDESNVGVEQQVLAISKNQFMHNMAVSIMSTQFRLLRSAVAEQV